MADPVRIGLWITRTDPYWVQINEAMYGYSQQLPVELIPLEAALEFSGRVEDDAQKLADDILAFGLSALIVTHITASAARLVLGAGLPIIQLTSTPIAHERLIAFEGYAAAGLLAAEFVAERLPAGGLVLAFGGMWATDGEGGQQRVAALRAVFDQRPALRWRHIPTPWAYPQAYPVIIEALRRCAEPIAAIVGISDTLALAAQSAAQSLGLLTDQTLIIGINGDPLALAAVAEGRMSATVDTDATSFGREALTAAYQIACGIPAPRRLRLRPALVTTQNVGDSALRKLIAIADIPTRLVGINRQAEQARLSQLELVATLNQQVGGILQRQALLAEVAELIRTHYRYDQIGVYRWQSADQALWKEYPHDGAAAEATITIAQAGLIGAVALSGEPAFIPDVRHSLRYPPDAAHPQSRSRATLPIRFNQQVVGVLDLHSSRQVQHLRHELLGLQLLADQIGIAAQNATLYEQSLQARAAAEKADQLKTRLLANVSHELRTPINLILGYCQLALKEPSALPERLQGDLRQIFQHGEHLVGLINDLLDMSRLEIDALELHPELIAPSPFLAGLFHGVADQPQAPAVTWRLELPDELPLIEADPLRLRQILLNLLHNAVKFTAAGEIALGAAVEPPHLHIWVRDTGIGIAPDDQQRIFEPFATGERATARRDGIGLGLSITRRLVLLHQGSITLESRLGAGSTFHLYLPLPGLAGPALPPATGAAPAALLLISRRPDPSPAILQLSQGLGLPIERMGQQPGGVARRPALIAWDLATAAPEDWEQIAQLRRSPELCRVPFVVFDQHQGGEGLTNVLLKPVPQTTLIELIEALRPAADQPVLIVDDDPHARDLYARLVAEALPGKSIQMAADGGAALALLATLTPGLVILDLMMPAVDGFGVLEAMRADARLASVPVLVLSGKLLTEEDARRLDFARVVFHRKELLRPGEAVAALQQALDDTARLPQPTSALVKRVLAYLHQEYAAPLSRQQIAHAVGVSERYLSEIFRQELGLSVWEALSRLRVQRACELLRQTTASIAEIAAQVGFDDPSYFGRVFSQQVGMSPRAYREQ